MKKAAYKEEDKWIWAEPSEEMQKGLELAAYICNMYGGGQPWAEAILCHSEQIRGRWWMEYDRRKALRELLEEQITNFNRE